MSDESKKPKPKRRLLRFSLRTFLIVVTLLCVWLAWFVYRVERQKKAVRWVKENGGRLYYDFQKDSKGIFVDDSQLAGPNWLHNFLGVDYFSTVVRVEFFDEQISDVTPLQTLSNLQTLSLSQTQVIDLTPLQSLKKLETLILRGTKINDLTPLKSLTNLKKLDLAETQVSDLTTLRFLTNLRELDLWGLYVNDLKPLRSLANLKDLYLSGNRISKPDIEKLQKALPNCTIWRD